MHSAGIQDTNGAKQVVQKLAMKHIKLKKLFADGGYKEKFINWAKLTHDLEIEIVKRSEQKKFVVLPKRWIVERTFSWLLRNRRLRADYERLKQSAESMVYIAMTRLMLKRLATEYN